MDFAVPLIVRERFLSEESAPLLLAEIRAGRQSRWLLVWIPLMKIDDNTDVVASWLELWAGEPDERQRNDILLLTKVFVGLSQQKEILGNKLEGLNVVKSPIMESLREKEGTGRSSHRRLLEILEEKFPGQVPAELRQTVEQTVDLARLRQWSAAALKATSIEEFRNASGI